MNEIDAYPLALPSWDNKEIEAIQKVIDSGRYSMGDSVSEFEQKFADKFGSRYAVMVNSGSSANLLAIDALRYKKDNPLKPGDEVIVPSLSWSTTYAPLYQCGLKLVFVDVDLSTLNLDVSQLELALSNKTKAMMVPNILGNPADYGVIKKFCEHHNLYLIEDNCESMGATLDGRYAGTFGLCGTFSTFFSHHITTMEGGVVVTDDEEIYHILLCLRSHGWTRHLPKDNTLCTKVENSFYESFRFILPGYNLRPIEMMGAIGVEQLKKLDGFLEKRRQNAQYFRELFEDDERFILQKSNGDSAWFGFSLVLTEKADVTRDQIVIHLAAANIETRPIIAGNFLENETIKYFDYRVVGDHQAAARIHKDGFFLGNHHIDLRPYLNYLKKVL